MSIGDAIGYQNNVEACVVCGKNVEHGGGFAKITNGGIIVNLCCALCMETFQKDPDPNRAWLAKIGSYRALKQTGK